MVPESSQDLTFVQEENKSKAIGQLCVHKIYCKAPKLQGSKQVSLK